MHIIFIATDVLNLIINGLPSKPATEIIINGVTYWKVLNLIINGLPSKPSIPANPINAVGSFKPYYKWITF